MQVSPAVKSRRPFARPVISPAVASNAVMVPEVQEEVPARLVVPTGRPRNPIAALCAVAMGRAWGADGRESRPRAGHHARLLRYHYRPGHACTPTRGTRQVEGRALAGWLVRVRLIANAVQTSLLALAREGYL